MFLCVLAFEVIQLLGWEQSSVGKNACPMHKALAPPLPKPDKVTHICNPRAWEGEAERLRRPGPSSGAQLLCGEPGLQEALSKNIIFYYILV